MSEALILLFSLNAYSDKAGAYPYIKKYVNFQQSCNVIMYRLKVLNMRYETLLTIVVVFLDFSSLAMESRDSVGHWCKQYVETTSMWLDSLCIDYVWNCYQCCKSRKIDVRTCSARNSGL